MIRISDNKALMESCRLFSEMDDLDEYDASAVIVKELWKDLKQTVRMRVVK